jgi:hypothetical protein
MKRLLQSLAAVTMLLGTTLAGTALAQDLPSNRDNASSQDRRQGDNQGWGSDRGQGNGSDRGQGWGSDRGGWGSDRGQGYGSDRGRFNRMSMEGRWVADNRSGDARGGRGERGMREMLLPDLIFIDQRPSMLRITDQRNQPLQTIMLGGKFDSRYGNDRPDYLVGRWNGSMLVVERSTPRGATITQTFALQDRGHTLVVRTRREGFGRRSFEITTTYRRA